MAKYCRLTLKTLLILCILSGFMLPDAGWAEHRIRGAIGIRGYGYVDADKNDHLWILQSTRISAYMPERTMSVHVSADWIGDREDDFGESARFRFLNGYLNYGQVHSAFKAKLGRFFLTRGVAVGTLDGIDLSQRLSSRVEVGLFAGMMGPITREFEFEKPEDAFSFGSELKINPRNCPLFDRSQLSLSYTRQTRGGEVVRQRVGLAIIGKRGNNWKFSGYLQARPERSILRRAIARARYSTESCMRYIELGILKPDIEDYSWFKDFEMDAYYRVKFGFRKMKVGGKWSCGLNATALLKGEETGVRLGPVITSPWGSAGYNQSMGTLSKSSGPWVALRYSIINGLEVSADWSLINYEWDAFEIKSDELTTFNTGCRYSPAFLPQMTISGEYQVYKTPQFNQDRRGLLGIKWRFDTAGGGK